MIILERDGSLFWQEPDSSSNDAKEFIDIPANLINQPNNIIDRVLDLVFDTLGLRTVELRVYEDSRAYPANDEMSAKEEL